MKTTVKLNGAVKTFTSSKELGQESIFMAKTVIKYVRKNTGVKLKLDFESSAPLMIAMDIVKEHAPKGEMKKILKPLAFYYGECARTKMPLEWVQDDDGIPYLFGNDPKQPFVYDVYEVIRDYSKKGATGEMDIERPIYPVKRIKTSE